ncbi:MAG: CcmD family protein [Acidobacteriota bacterium]
MNYLFAAYTAIWLGIFAYIWSLARRQQRLGDEIDSLRRRLDSGQKS